MRWRLPVGTRSVLYGAHQFLLHPWFVAAAWWRLYGFPWDPRLWVAFFVHDVGYLGKPNMDGPEGERHPETGAAIMRRLFGPTWGDFVLLHSRFYSKRLSLPLSRLCAADKLAIAYTPSWLYVPLARLTGEVREYRRELAEGKYRHERRSSAASDWQWHREVQAYCRAWAFEHADGRPDTWTRVEERGLTDRDRDLMRT